MKIIITVLILDKLRSLLDQIDDTQAFVVLVVPLDLVSHRSLLYPEPRHLLLYILVLLLLEEILVSIDHRLEDKALVGLH